MLLRLLQRIGAFQPMTILKMICWLSYIDMQGVQQCHFSTSILSYHFKYPCNISNPSPQKFVMENLFLPCDQTFIFLGSVFFWKMPFPKIPPVAGFLTFDVGPHQRRTILAWGPWGLEPTKRTNERQGVPAAATKVATGDVLGVPPIYLWGNSLEAGWWLDGRGKEWRATCQV